VTARCHLHLPITNSAGVVFPYATLEFFDFATGAPSTEPIFVQATGGNAVSTPLFCDPAVIDIWTDNPVRFRIVATVQGNVRIQLDGIDLLPEPTSIVQSPGRMRVTEPPNTALNTEVLMSSLPGEAAFRVANPLATHQHEGDSVGSVVLTGEDATDFNPYQSWVGYHAGENTSAYSAASSALGPHADVQGANATIVGIGQIIKQVSTGLPGDMATVLSSEDGTAAQGSTTIGAANITAQGRNATVVGSLNGTASTGTVPDGTVVVGQGNVLGAAGAVKIGPNHPTSTAGANHTAIGNANIAQSNGLPWAGAQTPTAVGTSTTLAGDPSTALSSDDWFGGVGPLALGVNSTSFNPSLSTLSGAAVTEMLLSVAGDVVVNGQRTYLGTTTTLGFFGATGIVRPKIPYNAGDVVNTQVTALCQALAKIGLIYTTDVPVVTESGTHADGTALEFAETGQAVQWKLPAASPAYRATNPFTIASNKVVMNTANAPFPTRGLAALYSGGLSDVSVQGRFTYNPTGTNLCTNPGFETDTSGWAGYDSGAVIARDTTKAKYGLSSLKITPPGTNIAVRAAFTLNGQSTGAQFNFSAYVMPTSSRNVRISIDGLTSGNVFSSTIGSVDTVLTPNVWTRISVSGTVLAGAPNLRFTVGYRSLDGTMAPAGETLNVDAAQIVSGVLLLPYVDTSGYHPDDLHTGLMFRTYNAQSVVLGQTQAVVTGYMVGRTAVYSMTDNTIGSTVATLSAQPATGDLLQADCNGTSVTIRKNGTSVGTFTDSTLNTRVKHGFRVCPSTSAYAFQVYPFGF
jgi:hypothetical protein